MHSKPAEEQLFSPRTAVVDRRGQWFSKLTTNASLPILQTAGNPGQSLGGVVPFGKNSATPPLRMSSEELGNAIGRGRGGQGGAGDSGARQADVRVRIGRASGGRLGARAGPDQRAVTAASPCASAGRCNASRSEKAQKLLGFLCTPNLLTAPHRLFLTTRSYVRGLPCERS